MSSEEISLNGLNSQLVFQDDPLRSFSCHQHHHHHRGVGGGGDPGPKTRELTGFIDDKIFSSVDRDRVDRYFRPQSAIFADHHPDRHRDHPQQQQQHHQEPRDWNNGHPATATTPSTDESDGDDDDVDDEDDDDGDEVENNNKNTNNSNNLNSNSNSVNCNNNNNSTNCSVVIPVGDKMGNGKAKQLSNSFGKNGNVMQTVNINNGALVTVAEADGDMYYSQYMQGTTDGSSGSGQKECVVVDNGCGISGSGGDSLRAILSDPVTGTLMDDAMILPCGHTFGAAGIQHISRTKACFTCTRPVSEDSIAPNLSLRAAVQAFRREEELQYYRSCKRRRERFDQDKGSFGDSTLNDLPRGRGVQFPFAVTDRVIIKGNKRTPQRFVGREAVVTTQCLNGWYVVKTLDNAESVKLQYRSLAKVPDDPSSKPTVTKMPPNWL